MHQHMIGHLSLLFKRFGIGNLVIPEHNVNFSRPVSLASVE